MMMNGWSGPMSAWDWIWMVIALAATSAVTAAGIALMVRSVRRGAGPAAIGSSATGSPPSSAPAVAGAEEVLADRFARGEIDEDEYWQRVQTLRAADQR